VLDRRLRHHVLRLLSAMPDPVDNADRWRLLLASRARVEQMWAHPGLLSKLRKDDRVRVGGDNAADHVGDGLSRSLVLDLYVADADFTKLVSQYKLRSDSDGQVRLHVVPRNAADVVCGRPGLVPPAAAAADLLDEDDPRARRSALLQLSAMLAALTNS
jgi:hypothetical protein